MDDLVRVFWTWREEIASVVFVLAGIVLLHHLGKMWNAGASLMAILGAGLLGAALPLYYGWNFGLSQRAAVFILLYIWCVLGMLFLAARQTHITKLVLGLASQAGIVYALFRLI